MSAPLLHFQIVTPTGLKFDDAIDQVTLTTALGEITILPGHIPLVSALVPGEAFIRQDQKEIPLVVYGGFCEVKTGNRVVVLADEAERVEEMDEQQVEEAHRAAQALQKESFNLAELEDAALAFSQQQARIRVFKKYRNRRK